MLNVLYLLVVRWTHVKALNLEFFDLEIGLGPIIRFSSFHRHLTLFPSIPHRYRQRHQQTTLLQQPFCCPICFLVGCMTREQRWPFAK